MFEDQMHLHRIAAGTRQDTAKFQKDCLGLAKE